MIQKITSRLLFVRYVACSSQHSEGLQHGIFAGREVAFWKPVGAPPPQGYPLILFSHGLGGSNTQSIFLMQALAHSGYLVLAPNHQDAHCDGATRGRSQWRAVWGLGFHQRHAESRRRIGWCDQTYEERAIDIWAVLNAALNGNEGLPIDAERIAAAGHSIGGYTALGVAGGWPSWKDRRIKAVLALASHCTPYIENGTLSCLDVPVMFQSGTRDLPGMPRMHRLREAYAGSPPPKFYVEFEGARHFAWTNLRRDYRQLICAYSVAFFDRYLKGTKHPDPLSSLIERPPDGVSHLQADA